MKIVIFNWRDLKNPKAGGAETVTHEIAKRWVKWGHEVTLFTASFAGGLEEEVVDGVRIIRQGGQVTVRFYAFNYYQKNLRGKVEVVIDEINTLPFFTPLYVKERKVVYFNQLAREVWFYESPFPLSLLGYLLEPLYLQFYRKTKAIVISESTKKDIQKLGIKNTKVFPMAIYFEEEQKYIEKKEKDLTLIFVGRLVKSKRPQEVIKAAAKLISKYPHLKVWLVGGGEEKFVTKLKNLALSLGIDSQVEFKGFVKEEEKFRLMSRAHLLLATSIREGWGLMVTEANAVKTPAIVYDVPGLRDAVKQGETGLIVAPNPQSLAQAIETLWEDEELYQKLQKASYSLARELTWDKTARVCLEAIS